MSSSLAPIFNRFTRDLLEKIDMNPGDKRKNGLADVRISTDKGLLRLQFSSKFSRAVWGRRQVFKGLGRPDTPEDRAWAFRIAGLIQADFDHPNKSLLDSSLEKYLSDRSFIEKSESCTLGSLWEEYSQWKLNNQLICQTTYLTRYSRTYKNWLLPWYHQPVNRLMVDNLASSLMKADNFKPTLKKMFSALTEMGERAEKLGKIPENFFADLRQLAKKVNTAKKSQQLKQLENYKAYTKEERDLIINAFYASDIYSERRMAELVEFLFLTGCREGEAFALKWQDIKEDYIVFSESYASDLKITKSTKTNTVRLFRITGYTRLLALLSQLKANKNISPNDYVFTTKGKQLNRAYLNRAWHGRYSNNVFYPGIVKKLVDDGIQYLKPSATRHTFISIQLKKGSDIKFLADSVGNSAGIIYKHYLGGDSQSFFEE